MYRDRKEYSKKYRETHKEQCNAASRKWNAEHSEKIRIANKKYEESHREKRQERQKSFEVKSYKRWYHLSKRYGITKKEFDDICSSQKNCCAICGEPLFGQGSKKPCVDHNHVTGEVRGILCFDCNIMIGFAKDREGVLLRACEYLRRKI